MPIEDENALVIAKEETITVEAHDRKKKNKKENHPVRKPFPADLPREVEKIYPAKHSFHPKRNHSETCMSPNES